MMEAVKIDFKTIRSGRQEQNNKEVFEAIMKKNKKDIEKLINNKELERVLNETNMNSDALYEYCFNNEVAAKILSGRISKKSSRQGSKDESKQIEICSKAGVNVKYCSYTSIFIFYSTNLIDQKSDASPLFVIYLYGI